MKITLRLILYLVLASGLVTGLFSYFQLQNENHRLSAELDRSASLLAESLTKSIQILLREDHPGRLQNFVQQFSHRERLLGLLVYDGNRKVLAKTSGIAGDSKEWLADVAKSESKRRSVSALRKLDGKRVHLYVTPIELPGPDAGALVQIQEDDFTGQGLTPLITHNFMRFILLSALLILTAFLVMRWSVTQPLEEIAGWLRQLRRGEVFQPLTLPRGTVLGPLATEINQIARSLTAARAAAQQEARLRHSAQAIWTPEKLKEHVRSLLGARSLYVISNREPYMHIREKRHHIECIVPASGLVTALEPVLRACGGTWIAHGSGNADRETVDRDQKVRVPPDEPAYTLKRVWLTPEEVKGHYDGFSNEGLWPLCHITHQRPTFRLEDWEHYQSVNRKFAEALLREIESEDAPVVLIQDYHFALLPAIIRERRPDAQIALFWHIPWPNPESFGICPWKQDILTGMLGADIIGFHIQFHCNNFLDTVDNTLESKIDWELFSVERGGHNTLVRPFPISVGQFSDSRLGTPSRNQVELREMLLKDYGIGARHVGVGVDRLDYTKGIIERLRAIERFLGKYPAYQGQFTFVELGAPSRDNIPKYHAFKEEVEKTVEEINARFRKDDWQPLVFLEGHHSHTEILPFYQTANLCLVTSLHDGMNLVAKEFISSRDDEDGVLILSQFTGASRELRDALIVNPYDTEGLAESIRQALEMPREERVARMQRLRTTVREKNVYRWAANLLMAITQLPSQKSGGAASRDPV